MKLVPIPPQLVEYYQEMIGEYIRPALKYSATKFSYRDVVSNCIIGEWLMYAIHQDNETKGAVITCLNYHPCEKIMSVLFMGGQKQQKVHILAMKELESIALELGCTQVQFIGREGWKKQFSDYETQTMYYKNIGVNQ